MEYLKAFACGGALCIIGQLVDWFGQCRPEVAYIRYRRMFPISHQGRQVADDLVELQERLVCIGYC